MYIYIYIYIYKYILYIYIYIYTFSYFIHLNIFSSGFRKGRSCCEQIFTLRQIVEKVTTLDTKLLMNFIDFKKAFDCLHRPSVRVSK